ncbi:MAG TPA: penicillin-binding transpeptidase domain-containing protein [Clostridium sp.]|uniref:penicillin-binding transpeptidase domain-containing protein n=1 Tax=Clostridium sp. TaxID=1506 RepID=UPI002F957A1D
MYKRNNIFGYSNQKSEIKKRIWIIMLIFALLFCILIWRIANDMYFKSEPLKAMFNAQYTINEQYGMLYKLTDCNGNELLNYSNNYYAVIDPVDYLRFNEYTSKYDMQSLIITLRNYNKGYDLEKIKGTGNGEKLRYKIDEATYNKIKDIKKVKGFYTFESNDLVENKNWKIQNVLTNLIYYNNKVETKKSSDSLEMQIYNKTKNNKFTGIRFSKGVNGEIAEGETIDTTNNVNVRLTLDENIQDKVEAILHEEKYEQIGVVLMESKSGKIRAMAQKDDIENNANLGIPSTGGALPGSIFKVIVEEAALDTGSINKNEIFTLSPGLFPDDTHQYNGKTEFTVSEALRDSSNNIFAQIGYKIGFQNMYDYAKKQGILDTVLNFQQEQIGKFDNGVGLLSPKEDIYQASIGQKIKITPLEALSIPNTVINNGVYVQPSIIDTYVNDKNGVVEKVTPKTSQVLKSETAKTLKLDMLDVVNNGTGVRAFVKGMDIGGKTGTTEYSVEGKKYSDGWFVGFFTFKGIDYSMVVFVKNITLGQKEGIGSQGGGDTAAPIFKKVVEALSIK